MTCRRWLAGVGALAAALAVGACASLPTSGTIRTSSLHGSSGSGQPGLQVLPAPPGPQWSPDEIVTGFLAASASFAGRHAVAREYLTQAFANEWDPGWAATVIASPAVTEHSLPTQLSTGSPRIAQVTVTGSYTASMTTEAEYAAGNLVATPRPDTFSFALIEIGGKWRIENIFLDGKQQPTLLLLAQPDFERDYQPRDLYYFRTGIPPGGSFAGSLIPEPVYIPLRANGPSAVAGMVKSLRSSPSDTSWLYDAAVTAFPHGTRVIGAQVIGGVEAVVDLGGAAAKAHAAQLRQMAAQIFWTLTSQPFAPSGGSQIRSVVLQIDHKTWQQMLHPPYDPQWVARGQSSELYVQEPGTAPASAVKIVPAAGSYPVTVPASLGNAPFTAIAVTPGPQNEAVLAACRGKQVYLVPQWSGGPVVTVQLPASCSSLSWDDQRNLWATAGNWAYELPGAGFGSPVKPKLVRADCTSSACLGTISALSVAPDGVRVAMIVRTRESSQVVVAAISRSNSFTYLGQTGAVVSIGSDVTNPVALTWLDPDHLLVVGQSAGGSQIYEVPLTGGSSTPIAAPPGLVTSVTASWVNGADLPAVVVGVAPTAKTSAGVWEAKAGLLDRGWTLIAKGTTPVYGG